jgi:signal transduction histidine kinase
MKVPRFGSPTIRLALSYLAIIMTLSLGFSILFYSTSSGSLHVEKQNSSGAILPTGPQGSFSMRTDSGPTAIPSSGSGIDAQLQQRLNAVRSDLLHRLIALNLGALLLGFFLSYYLAQRTLRPIEAAMEAQARFSSDASHELRTPLTALRTRSEVALRKPDLTLDEAKAVIASSIEQAIKLQDLSSGLLRLSRDNGKNLKRQSIWLDEIAGEALNRIREIAQANHIDLQLTVPHVSILGDVESLTQVITILLDNAVKYSKPGGVIRLTGGSEGKRGFLKVHDKGVGISPADVPHIFERFYRADQSRAHKVKDGHGLGLAIAKQLTEQSGSTISVESTLGKGSIFTIKLPLARL